MRIVALILLLVVSTAICNKRVYAQDIDFSKLELPEGLESKPDELEAWIYTELHRYIRARELAETVLRKRPTSYIAHLVLGLTQHYAEANFPRAVYHLDLALTLYEQQHDVKKPKGHPWRWHVAILKELSAAYGAMEQFSRQLAYMARYNELYEPDMVAERAWPLMKLRRFKEARLAANLGLKTNRDDQREIALNALCAIEFEQGNDQASYRACKNAVDDAALVGRSPSSVDLTNYAEAARSMLRLDLAERIALDATVATVSWYANPWLELSELYMRQGRYEDALSALKEIPQYRAARPPHVRDSDRNETRRALASFLLLLGRPDDALAFTSKAGVAPDRRAHNSRDPLQDQLVIAMLDRRARLVAAEICMERVYAEPLVKLLYKWPLAWLKASWLRFQAWRSAAKAKRLLLDDQRLTGVFQVGTSEAAVVPPWLTGELISIMGAGIVREAIDRARKEDHRKGASAYYDALLSEVAATFGKYERALELAERAVGALGQGEALLRARARAIAAVAAMRLGQTDTALEYYETALRSDRGVFRRLGLPIPVRITDRGGEYAHRIKSALEESPRLDVSNSGFELSIEASGSNASVCMIGAKGAVFDCTRVVANKNDDAIAFASRVVRKFNSNFFSPRVDFTRTDINSLDGTNIAARDTIESVFDDPE